MPDICKEDGCEGLARGRGYCGKHYMRLRRHGDVSTKILDRGGPIEFMKKAIAYEGDDCLIWPFYRNKYGRPQFWNGTTQSVASRHVCMEVYGRPDDESMQAAHSCGRGHEGCVNPNHLRWATRKENEADKIMHGTLVKGEDHVNSKIKEEDVREIKKMLGKVSQAKIAKNYGITQSAVSLIALGKTWRHV